MGHPVKKWVFTSALMAGLSVGQQAQAADAEDANDSEKMKRNIIKDAITRYFSPFSTLSDDKKIPKKNVFMYKVKPGDTLTQIAEEHDADIEELIHMNKIRNPQLIGIGLELKIPVDRKHVVRQEDTVTAIAKKWGVSEASIKEENPSLTSAADILYAGQILNIPEPEETWPPSFSPEKSTVSIASVDAASSGRFAWPVTGEVTSRFGARWGSFHRGVDIWNQKESRTPIVAAQAGEVAFSGWDRGYGNKVVLSHGAGWSTHYAHLSKRSAPEGTWLEQGDVLGYMGVTGDTTGYHLHFEIRMNGRAVDPLRYLK